MDRVDFSQFVAAFDRDWWRVVRRHVESVAAADRIGAVEAEILFELAEAGEEGLPGPLLAARVGADRGYLARCLHAMAEKDWVASSADTDDARVKWFRLRGPGSRAARGLRSAVEIRIAETLEGMDAATRTEIVRALKDVRQHLSPPAAARHDFVRSARREDYGWVIERHGTLYAAEHDYDASFVAFVAEGVARFIREHDPGREHAFIAEQGGRRTGCAFVVKESARVARLRFFLVEPEARGRGVGRFLLSQVNGFATSCGYERIVLWTQSHLHAALSLYRERGFKLVKEEPHPGWGRPVRAQEWALDLKAPAK